MEGAGRWGCTKEDQKWDEGRKVEGNLLLQKKNRKEKITSWLLLSAEPFSHCFQSRRVQERTSRS